MSSAGSAAGQMAGAAQRAMGLRPGTQFYTPFPFAGMNTQASPVAIDDKEFWYMENFVRVGDGNLRTAYDHGPAFYTPNQKIVMFYPFSRGISYYIAVFLADGSAVELAWPSGAARQIGGPGTFYKYINPLQLPACRQWGVIYLLISNRT